MNFLDTHFHLDLWPTPHELLQKIEEHKIYSIAVTNTPSVFSFTANLTRKSKYVRAALGLHPELVFERHAELPEFHKQLSFTRYIGEVGLDYSSNDKTNHRLQRAVFESIVVGCVESKNKVLTIHSRGAENDVIEIVGDKFPGKAILHWYSGGIKTLEKAIDYGFYFSINGAMINSKSGKSIVARIPSHRILTESDGPFIKNNLGNATSPLEISHTVKELATFLNCDILTMREIIYSNFKEVLQ